MLIEILLFCLTVSLVLGYLLGQNNEHYWRKRGVKFYGRNKLTGVFWDFLTQKGGLFQKYSALYKKYKNEPAIGIGSFCTPTLFVIHPKNIQHVLQTDFSSFYHRGIEINERDQLADSILFTNGPRWKLMRQSMTPLFTSTKLRSMYYIIDKSAQDLVQYLKDNPKMLKGGNFDLIMTYCNASVCGAIFGIGSESVFDSPFLKMATTVTAPSLINNMKFAVASLSPRLSKFLGIMFFKEYEDFLVDAIKKLIQQREKENVRRHDFADLCVNIKKNGTMKDSLTGTELEPSYGFMAAQAMFFLIAGVEPVAVAIFTTLVEIGRHSDILEKVHHEVDKCFDKHGKTLSYDAISEMSYVDQVISEAMRINPPIGFLSRKCVRDTILPVGDIKVESGTNMFTPIYDIHNDPDFYPEPHVFDPERFAAGFKPSDEIYMPFGMGNRVCIGARFSKLQVAAGLVHMLRHFTVKLKEVGGPVTYKPHFNIVRRTDVDVELIPRKDIY